MCYRFYIDLFFRKKLKKDMDDGGMSLRENAFDELCRARDVHPSETALVVARPNNVLTAECMKWGFTGPVDNGLLFNARSETAGEKYTFADSFLKRRCVIPASGFYEWDRNKARFRFFREDDGLLWLAGIYREEMGLLRFTILTREAAGCMIPVHSRMPLTIEKEDIRSWISDDDSYASMIPGNPKDLVCRQDEGQISMDLSFLTDIS